MSLFASISKVWKDPIFTSLASCETRPEICNAAEGSVTADEDEGSVEVVAWPVADVEGEKRTAETSIVSSIFFRVESVEPVADVVCIRLIDSN